MRNPDNCAHGTTTLTSPRRSDEALIEIYMEKPKGSHSGELYALRSVMMTKGNGPDLERRRTDIQAEGRALPGARRRSTFHERMTGGDHAWYRRSSRIR